MQAHVLRQQQLDEWGAIREYAGEEFDDRGARLPKALQLAGDDLAPIVTLCQR